MTRPFRFGMLSGAGDPQGWQRDVARAEQDGYSTIVLTDHLDLSGAHVTRLSWLPAFADALARTSRLHASVMVANQDLRHPAVLARDVTTLDRLSGGRDGARPRRRPRRAGVRLGRDRLRPGRRTGGPAGRVRRRRPRAHHRRAGDVLVRRAALHHHRHAGRAAAHPGPPPDHDRRRPTPGALDRGDPGRHRQPQQHPRRRPRRRGALREGRLGRGGRRRTDGRDRAGHVRADRRRAGPGPPRPSSNSPSRGTRSPSGSRRACRSRRSPRPPSPWLGPRRPSSSGCRSGANAMASATTSYLPGPPT